MLHFLFSFSLSHTKVQSGWRNCLVSTFCLFFVFISRGCTIAPPPPSFALPRLNLRASRRCSATEIDHTYSVNLEGHISIEGSGRRGAVGAENKSLSDGVPPLPQPCEALSQAGWVIKLCLCLLIWLPLCKFLDVMQIWHLWDVCKKLCVNKYMNRRWNKLNQLFCSSSSAHLAAILLNSS